MPQYFIVWANGKRTRIKTDDEKEARLEYAVSYTETAHMPAGLVGKRNFPERLIKVTDDNEETLIWGEPSKQPRK